MFSETIPDTLILTNQPEPQPSSDASKEGDADLNECVPMLPNNGTESGDISIKKVKKSNKKKSVRCEECRKKIGSLAFKCKCSSELAFCSSHIQPELHKCTFDHKTDALDRLSSTLPKITHDKIIRI